MKNRIKKVRLDSGLSQPEFGKRISISRSAVWKLENGENMPSEQTIKLICKEFKVRYIWLTEGIEPIYEEMDWDSISQIDAIMTGENEFAKNLFKEFAKLDEDEWKLLEKLIKKLAKDKGE